MVYRIEVLGHDGSWSPDIGDGNVFWTETEAWEAVDELRGLGDDWANSEFRVEPVEWLGTQDAADLLNVSAGRVRQLVAEGRIPVTQVGGVNLIRPADLEAVRHRPVGRPRSAT